MMQRCGCLGFSVEQKPVIAAVGVAIVLTAMVMIGLTRPAAALPAFARQTGQPCGKCHTDFPSLTPFGRRFKLGGYTLGGGEFRTTPFPSSDDPKATTDKLNSYAKSMDSAKGRQRGQGLGSADCVDDDRRLYPYANAADSADGPVQTQ